MPEVMDADAVESGAGPDPTPRMLQIGQMRAWFLAGNDPSFAAVALEAVYGAFGELDPLLHGTSFES